jgi:hypothetical protein
MPTPTSASEAAALVCAAAALLSITLWSEAVFAETASPAPACATAPVTAKGEPGSFQWIAKTKARANWRAKVRAVSDLGPDYANWGNAKDPVEDCQTGAAGITCVFTGTPCKP